jgi:predicted permease
MEPKIIVPLVVLLFSFRVRSTGSDVLFVRTSVPLSTFHVTICRHATRNPSKKGLGKQYNSETISFFNFLPEDILT